VRGGDDTTTEGAPEGNVYKIQLLPVGMSPVVSTYAFWEALIKVQFHTYFGHCQAFHLQCGFIHLYKIPKLVTYLSEDARGAEL